ncbi:glycoside hydrolase family 20 protein [Boletus reticuloceps]|uniref:Beta-hexosaminidase n=1 Tax=Boletus reticuloceps TaxID=495285 RepID=A0A8I3A7U9_9AGAM|nr:glycoside hydrolase family 20 protein [Boletus reticuloceps]
MALRFLLALSLLHSVWALWPIPATLSTGNTALVLSSNFYFDVAVQNAPADLQNAVQQAQYYLENDKLGRLVVGRGANDSAVVTNAKSLPSLKLSLASGATVNPIVIESVKPLGTRSEEYVLTVPADGSPATLSASSTLGLYRGLTTFGQMWYYYGGKTYTLEAPISITDVPAYPYRGFGLDTSRNYFPVADLQRTLDAMSWVKINTFHWHIVDSQSFPLEVSQYPQLAANGAYSADQTYSESDVQNLVQYAAERGIDVIMEIDTPGHTAIIGTTYPEYVACMDASPWSTYANEPPAGQLRFALPEVVNFTTSLLSSVAKTLPSSYFSTGGDELNTNCYVNDTLTQQQLKSANTTLAGALATFTNITHSALIAEGKTPVVWEEMVLVWNLTLSKEAIIMIWISSEDAAAVANLGYRIVHAPSNYFYLDCGAGEWLGDDPTGNSWCDPFKTWSEVSGLYGHLHIPRPGPDANPFPQSYTFDPLANLTESQYSLVLGGEQILWAEQSGPENLDSIVWPRAVSAAEIFWSAKQPSGAPLNVSEALPRLHDVRYRMVQRGLNPINLQPQWCALRPHACDLYA